jgi:LacI family transcriptional regulator
MSERTNTLGLVIPEITNPFFPTLVQAIDRAGRERGLSILIADSNNDAGVERAALRTLIDRRVDAILISPTHLTESVDGLVEAGRAVPTIQIDRVIDDALPYVRADQSGPIAAIVDHLCNSGRRHLAFIGQQPTIATTHEREEAFAALMAEAFPDEPLRVVKDGMSSAETGRAASRTIMSTWPETDAIVCANDLIAMGVLQDLGTHPGRREVAVSGYDDTLYARIMRLTSVRQPVEQFAELALTAIAGPEGSVAELAVELSSEVMLRFTTA